jgi:hypothetical protein
MPAKLREANPPCKRKPYAVASHNSYGQTADCVLVHMNTEPAGEKLINRRSEYVAVSGSGESGEPISAAS